MKFVLWLDLSVLALLSFAAGIHNSHAQNRINRNLISSEKTKKIAQKEPNRSKQNSKRPKSPSAFQKSGQNAAKVKRLSNTSKSSSWSSSWSSSSSDNWNPVEIAFEQESPIWNKPVREVHDLMGFPSVITKCHKKGDLALTFDDGLSAVTLDVIEMLKREKVTATFFIIGQTLELRTIGNRQPTAILEALLENSHELASHSYSHPNFNDYWPEGIECEMNKTAGLFDSLIGRKPRFMRPPFGNASERTIKALHNLGYFIINWNADTNDWLHKNTPERALLEFHNKVPSLAHLKMIQLQKGPNQKAALLNALDSKIVLMHDILPNIVDYGPKIIAHARALGYNFVTMSECLGGVNPYFKDD